VPATLSHPRDHGHRRVALPAHRPGDGSGAFAVGPIARWALYAFVFSLPFESTNRALVEYDVTTVTGFLFLAATLTSPIACYRRLPAAYWCFLIYLYVFGLSFVLNGGEYGVEVERMFYAILQPLLISLAACNMMRDDRIVRRTLLTLVAGCVGLALLQMAGVANSVADLGGGVHRATVLGQNPNRTARLLGTGLVLVIGLAYGREKDGLRPRIIAWLPAALLLTAMIRTGSRGALLAIGLGLWTFSLAGKTLQAKVRSACTVVIALALAAVLVLQSDLMRARLEMAESGNLAKREEIFPTAFALFAERPLIGWGPVANKYEVGTRLPQHLDDKRDTHNMLLELFSSTGIAGAVPFLVGLALCLTAAWRARHGQQGVLPLALMAMTALSNMSGNFVAFKIQWVILGYVIASGTYHGRRARSASDASRVGAALPGEAAGVRS
jgi:O-antigen ligase